MTRGNAFPPCLLLASVLLAGMAPGDAESEIAACMSCHDGSAAIVIRAAASHPVGVGYDQRRAWQRSLRPSTAASGFGSTIAADMLVDGKVVCTSCHERHDSGTGNPFQLRDARAPRVCLACHDPQ